VARRQRRHPIGPLTLAFCGIGAYDGVLPAGEMDKEFAHYRVHARIGQGGMGEVYVADDLTLNRKVALKFLLSSGASELAGSADSDDGEGRRRLLREARAAAQLDHPFICKVYEVAEHEGKTFLAMEYVEGATLKARLASGSLTTDEATRIGGEVAEALHFAHTRGIVHRDVKPANVMLTADGHVKVMDFGVAKRMVAPLAADEVTAGAPTGTLPGEPTGTLAYMSPEQIRSEPIDARSDVFAFGVLLHELLTGVHPFRRSSPLETAHAIVSEAATPIEQSGVPPLLAHIVARCLEKDRARRYQSLGDVRLELDAVLKPQAPTGAAVRSRPRRWIRVAGGLTAVLAVVVIVWMRPWALVAPQPALAFQERDWIIVSDFNNLTNDPVFDRSLRLALEVAIAQSQYVNVYPPHRVAATLQRMQKKVERFDETLASEVAVRDGIRGVLACDIAQVGSVYALTARLIDPKTRAAVLTDQAEATNKDAVLRALGELATRVRGSLGESLAGLSEQVKPLPMVTTFSIEALKLYADSLRLDAQSTIGASNAMLRQAIALDPDFALAYAELGRRYYLESARAAREEAEQLFAKALELTDRLSLRERLWVQAVAPQQVEGPPLARAAPDVSRPICRCGSRAPQSHRPRSDLQREGQRVPGSDVPGHRPFGTGSATRGGCRMERTGSADRPTLARPKLALAACQAAGAPWTGPRCAAPRGAHAENRGECDR